MFSSDFATGTLRDVRDRQGLEVGLWDASQASSSAIASLTAWRIFCLQPK